MDPGSAACRDDGDEILDPGSAAYRDDGDETLDPRSQNAFEMVRALWII